MRESPSAGRPGRRPEPARVERLLALYVVLYGIQAMYSSDFEKALQQMVFFYVPFALLYRLLRDLDWDRRDGAPAACGCWSVLAVVFAGIGFVEYATKTIILNSKLVVDQRPAHLLHRQLGVLRS